MCIRGNEIGIVSFEGREGKREMERERDRKVRSRGKESEGRSKETVTKTGARVRGG